MNWLKSHEEHTQTACGAPLQRTGASSDKPFTIMVNGLSEGQSNRNHFVVAVPGEDHHGPHPAQQPLSGFGVIGRHVHNFVYTPRRRQYWFGVPCHRQGGLGTGMGQARRTRRDHTQPRRHQEKPASVRHVFRFRLRLVATSFDVPFVVVDSLSCAVMLGNEFLN